MIWRQFILAIGLYMTAEIDTEGFRVYWADSSRTIASKGDLSCYWDEILSYGDFLGTALSYLQIRDLLRRLCHRLIAHTIVWRGHTLEKVTHTDLYFLKSMDQEALADHFGFLTEESQPGTNVVVRELGEIDLDKLVRLYIYDSLGDVWTWVAPGPERQPIATVSAPMVAEGALDEEEARLKEEVYGIQVSLGEQREVTDAMAKDLSRFTVWADGGISQLLDLAKATYMRYSETHVPYQRRKVRQRTGYVFQLV
ncbi:hypothetical protein Tco_0104011 [Tanacetum coccineum]